MKKFAKNIWIITLIIGVILIFFAISKFKTASDMYVPEMSDAGWFDASEEQSVIRVQGFVFLIFGVFIGLFVTIFIFTASRATDAVTKIGKLFGQSNTDTANIFKEEAPEQDFGIEIKKSNTCEYCGADLGENTCCPHCGAKRVK